MAVTNALQFTFIIIALHLKCLFHVNPSWRDTMPPNRYEENKQLYDKHSTKFFIRLKQKPNITMTND